MDSTTQQANISLKLELSYLLGLAIMLAMQFLTLDWSDVQIWDILTILCCFMSVHIHLNGLFLICWRWYMPV